MNALPIVVLMVAFAVLLTVGVERILRRYGVRPEDADAARGGPEQLMHAWRDWRSGRKRR